jgi:hypothetical protein
VGQRTGLSAAAVERALAAKSPERAAVLCRAAGFGANGFSAVLRMRRRRLREDGVNPAHALSDFLQTPMDAAQGALALIKLDDC